MIRNYLVGFVFLISSFVATAQDLDINTALVNYESLISTNQDLPAAKLSYRIGDHYLAKQQFAEAKGYFEKSIGHASKVGDHMLSGQAAYKKGLSQKEYAESGKLPMAEEQQLYKDCIVSFKTAVDKFLLANKKGSKEHLYSLFYGGEALYIIGNYREAIKPLRTVLNYAQKNRQESLVLKSSDLLARNYDQLDDELNHEYYQSVYDSYHELKVSKDSLNHARFQLQLSKDSLAKSHQKLKISIDSLQRTQNSLKLTAESLNKSKDSLMRSKESLQLSEASLMKAQDSLAQSKDSLERSIMEIALLDSANLEQRSALEIRQAEIIQQQAEIIKQQDEINRKENEVKEERDRYRKLSGILSENQELLNYMIGATALAGILFVFVFFAYQYKRRMNKKLEANYRQINSQKSLLEKRQTELTNEKSKTEALLLNILPAPVADELRSKKRVIPRYYKMVTIMFTDFKGFTAIAEQMSPGEIVRELDACFVAFDQIIERYEKAVDRKCIEKIKTIGDGYMCAGGVPHENNTNPLDVVRVALAMIDYMEKRAVEKQAKNEPFFEIRIGINTGPVVAGVVGKKKFAYDIWGDAVNLASRMESSGEVGRVNISGDTYKYLKDKYFFTHRGKINAKNKGDMDMYFVDGRVKYNKKDEPTQA